MTKGNAASWTGIAVFLLATWGCTGFFEGTGKILVSDSEEAKLGAQFHHHLSTNDTARQEMPVFRPANAEQQAFQSYVQGIFQEVLSKVPPKQRPSYAFSLTIIDKDVENAFAVPGGYVYLYTGIVKKMRDESELAGVLGHEITHITEHHFRENVAKNQSLYLGLYALLQGTQAGQVAQMAAGTFYQLMGLKFSRDQERQADKEGTLLLAATGRSPLGIATFFSRMKGQGPAWLSTHPGPRDRVNYIHKLVQSRAELKALAANASSTRNEESFMRHTAWMR